MNVKWAAIAVMLTLALLVVVSGTRRRPSVGFMIDVATALKDCGDGRLFLASAVGDRRVTLNPEPSIDIRDLPAQLRKKVENRTEVVVFVKADPGVSFGEFVQLVDAVHSEADIISLVTPQIDALARIVALPGTLEWEMRPPRCLAASCRRCDDLASFGRRSTRKGMADGLPGPR
jgi:biopolymer transport protein ExbD